MVVLKYKTQFFKFIALLKITTVAHNEYNSISTSNFHSQSTKATLMKKYLERERREINCKELGKSQILVWNEVRKNLIYIGFFFLKMETIHGPFKWPNRLSTWNNQLFMPNMKALDRGQLPIINIL